MSKLPLTPVELATIDRLESLQADDKYYPLLGLDQRAAREDVEAAYREFVRDWHPDRFYSRDAGSALARIEQNFVHVTRAYKTLRDEKKRAAYDADLRSRGVVVAEQGPKREEKSGFEVKLNRPEGGGRATAKVQPLGAVAAPSTPPISLKPSAPAPVARLKTQIAEQLARAKSYYEAGAEDFAAGRFSKAESSLYLAMKHDPRNTVYGELFQKAQVKAKAGRAQLYTSQAEQAEQFGNVKDAVANYRKAIECDGEEGRPYARLAVLLRQNEEDSKEPLALMRRAVLKEPKNVNFRVALAEMFLELKMIQNAQREVQAAAGVDPANAKVKALLKQLR